MFCNFFFFKQKTAYEMRISDWSSDVCSSDPLDFGTGLSGDTQRLHLHHHTTRLSWRWVQFPDFFAGARLGSGFRTGKTHRRGSGFENELAQRRCERFLKPRGLNRKRGVEGKGVEVRVNIGGRLIIKKKKKNQIL